MQYCIVIIIIIIIKYIIILSLKSIGQRVVKDGGDKNCTIDLSDTQNYVVTF